MTREFLMRSTLYKVHSPHHSTESHPFFSARFFVEMMLDFPKVMQALSWYLARLEYSCSPHSCLPSSPAPLAVLDLLMVTCTSQSIALMPPPNPFLTGGKLIITQVLLSSWQMLHCCLTQHITSWKVTSPSTKASKSIFASIFLY